MASKNSEMIISNELRLCRVKGELGYFHCWEHYSTVIEPSPLMGGAPGGTISYVNAIVETKDGVIRAPLSSIKFCDETHQMIANWCDLEESES